MPEINRPTGKVIAARGAVVDVAFGAGELRSG
jgi:hypothetical protein